MGWVRAFEARALGMSVVGADMTCDLSKLQMTCVRDGKEGPVLPTSELGHALQADEEGPVIQAGELGQALRASEEGSALRAGRLFQRTCDQSEPALV